MARAIIQSKSFQGLSRGDKYGIANSFLWSRSCDYRSDSSKLTILPRTVKSSGSVVLDLVMWGERYSTDTYFYGNAGHIYKKTSADVWTDLRTINDSHGNGFCYFGEDQYMYYPSDTVIGRYGPMSGTASFSDDFLGAEGGVPLNTYSLDLEASSSQYGHAADSASLSITGDLSIEACAKFESLPAVGASMVFASKWDGLSDERSYFFEMYAVSGYFGDGSDGALTISSDTTEAPIDSACTGTAATYALTATNVSFAAGQKVLVHQSRGTGAGKWERNEIASYTAGTITLQNAMTNSYTTGAQVRVLKQYTNVTVNSAKTYTCKAWNGTVGGILAFLASGTVTVTGTITASGTNGTASLPAGGGSVGATTGGGFRGGSGYRGAGASSAYCGEGSSGATAQQKTANGNGGGGGNISDNDHASGGGGGGNGTVGVNGYTNDPGGGGGYGGSVFGSADLTTMAFGGGGGGGNLSTEGTGSSVGSGGSGGGIVFISGTTVTITGTITSSGGNGGGADSAWNTGGGGGAGGSVLIKAQTATLGTALITASGGSGGGYDNNQGGAGGVGRVHLDYYTSYTGTTSPTLDVILDSNLVTSTTYQLRLGVCATDGTSGNAEYLVKSLDSLSTGIWSRYGVSWDASASLATFYKDGVNLGTATGAKTSIYDSTALFAVGSKYNDAGTAGSFFDGLIDDVRLWNDIRTDSEMVAYKESQLAGTEGGLAGYWSLNNNDDDVTANNNDLTLEATPVYSQDVPYSAATTRRDLDQSLDTSGQVYSLTTAIDEGATHRQTFVPAKDPLKSIQVNVSDTGDDSDWTLTVHDGLNRVVNSKTIAHAALSTGDVEFIFSTPSRVVLGASYHFHLTATTTTGAPAVVTTTTTDLETADFHTYYSFLVDNNYHPVEKMLNFMAIGNERYIAKYDAITYSPHAITLPSGYSVRCLGRWREYLAIGTVQGTNIYDYDQGKIFFWDGISTTYNFYVDVPEGGINAILSGDPIYFVAGYAGILMKYSGGSPYKIRQFPKMTNTTYMEVAPGGINMWRALVHIGVAQSSDNSSLEKGVYSYGSLFEDVTETMSFDYPTSLGINTGTSLNIGCVYPVGKSLFIAWQNGTSYGVDKVAPTNALFPTATCEFLITDADRIYQEKETQFLRGLFKSLVSGDTINLKYKIDRESSWVEGTAASTAGLKEIRVPLPTKGTRFNEFQYAVDLTTTNTTSPEFYGVGGEIDDLQHEHRLGRT